jgi:hypothetical protein
MATEIDYMEYANDAAAQAAYVTNGSDVTVTKTSGASTWTVPAGVFEISVECWGGGASGGGSGIADALKISIGGGGGGGAYVKKKFSVTPASNISYSVAAAVSGTSGAAGTDGNPTWFSSNDSSGAVAAGGTKGGYVRSHNYGTAGGAGGAGGTTAASYGDTEYAGGNGKQGLTYGGGGGGGAGSTGVGGNAPACPTGGTGTSLGGGNGGAGASSAADGSAGNTYGGGGGGALSGAAPARTGGAGAAGKIIITYKELQSFKEATIKTQGTYALKAGAEITSSLNQTLTKTF